MLDSTTEQIEAQRADAYGEEGDELASLINGTVSGVMALLDELNCDSVKRRLHIHDVLGLITDLIKKRIQERSEMEMAEDSDTFCDDGIAEWTGELDDARLEEELFEEDPDEFLHQGYEEDASEEEDGSEEDDFEEAEVPLRQIASSRVKIRDAANRDVINTVFTYWFPRCEPGSSILREIHEQTGIGRETLRRWHRYWEADNCWRPWHRARPGTKPWFTEAETEEILEQARSWVAEGEYVTGERILALLNEASLRFGKPREFSVRSAQRWAKAHGFSKRRAHHKRRRLNTQGKGDGHLFITTIKDLTANEGAGWVANTDETNMVLTPSSVRTYALRGSDNVQLATANPEKQCFTAQPCIAADGSMAQTIVYATGKTERCHRQFEGARGVKVVHSVNGWTTRQEFVKALPHFRATHPEWAKHPEKTVHLIVDLHTSHRGPEVQAAAQEANFQLHYVPAGQTDKLQPFDRWIFGPVKQKIRGKWAQFVHADPDAVVKKGMVANWLVEALVGLHPRVVERAWEIFV